jgi:hypothetical protein
MNEKIEAALKVIFQLTGAEAIEIHSGDREPGTYISRESIMGKEQPGRTDPA